MTSVFEVLDNKERLVEEDLVNATDQKHQSAIQTKKEDEPSRKYFMICKTCFWCVSYIDIMGNMDALPYKPCPTCDHTAIELLPLSDGEHYHLNIPQSAELF
ncbi:MAG TPA: hypothetical protein VEL11_06530 [Candidatus Bathyarchaeia archaeon]|nr:hypothetical protein [Candidatus Bathyarchaeia archaeon]